MSFVYIKRQAPSGQSELLKAAKSGNEDAIKELLERNARVWTYPQLRALNYYLKVKDQISQNGRKMYEVEMPFEREPFRPMEMAKVLWVQDIKEDYYLMCIQFEDGLLNYWLCEFFQEFKPLCNVTEWRMR